VWAGREQGEKKTLRESIDGGNAGASKLSSTLNVFQDKDNKKKQTTVIRVDSLNPGVWRSLKWECD